MGMHVAVEPHTCWLIWQPLLAGQPAPVELARSHSGFGYVPGAGAHTPFEEQTCDALPHMLFWSQGGAQYVTPAASTGGGPPGFELLLEQATSATAAALPPSESPRARPFQTALLIEASSSIQGAIP
jgi:hypothetical protein